MKIATSILSSEDRIKSVQELNHTHSSYIHVDVMDGKFVDNIQFETYEKIHSIHLVTKYPMDVHLMVDNPLEYIEQLSNMNIEFISFHIEVKKDIKKIIDKIHELGYKASIAIKPNTDIRKLEDYLDMIDMILVMSVEPGDGGKKFILSAVDRIKKVKELIGDRNILVEVDGGINGNTIGNVRDVDIAVVGSYIVKSNNYSERIDELLFDSNNEDENESSSEDTGSLPTIFFGLPLLFAPIFIISISLAGDGELADFLLNACIVLIFVMFFYVVIKTIIGSKKGKDDDFDKRL